jgi:hypothetical protein
LRKKASQAEEEKQHTEKTGKRAAKWDIGEKDPRPQVAVRKQQRLKQRECGQIGTSAKWIDTSGLNK